MRNGKVKIIVPARNVHQEFYRWKKTDNFKRWQRNQFLRQGGLCFYCEDPLTFTKINVEHIKPRSKGGTNKKSNLVLACSNCNRKKGSNIIKGVSRLRKRAKRNRGTYLKNKTYFDNNLLPYTEEALIEKIIEITQV